MSRKLLAGLLLSLMAGAAFAAPPAFEDVDINGDGSISAEEAQTVEGLDFTAADTDGNGTLSPEEYKAAVANM